MNTMLKRILLFVFVLFTAASFVSCGDKSADTDSEIKISNVFRCDMIDLPSDFEIFTKRLMMIDDRIGVLSVKSITNEDGSYSAEYAVFSFDTDGSDIKREDIAASRENWMVMDIFPLSGGGHMCLERTFINDLLKMDIVLSDENKKAIFTVDIEKLFDEDFSKLQYYSGIGFEIKAVIDYMDENGKTVYLVCSNKKIAALDSTGKSLYTLDIGGTAENMIKDDDGKIAVLYNQNSKQKVAYFDTAEKKFGDAVNIPQNTGDIAQTKLFMGNGYDLYMKTVNGLYGINTAADGGEAQSTEVINWLNSDVIPSDVASIYVVNKQKMIVTMYNHFTNISELAVLTMVPQDQIVQKQVVTYAQFTQDYYMQYAIADFNRNSSDYRIVLKDYTQYIDQSSIEGLQHPTEVFNAEIAAGVIPDIIGFDIGMSGSLPIESYVKKGLFCDIYSLMDENGYDRDQLMPNAARPFEMDGKLNYLPIHTTYSACILDTSHENFTTRDAIEMIENLGENQYISENLTNRVAVLRYFLKSGLIDFVDFENGTCDFDCKEFIDILEACKRIPDTPPTIEVNRESRKQMYANGTLKMYEISMTSFDAYLRGYSLFGNNMNFVNYPTQSGDNGILRVSRIDMALGVTADSTVKKQAFELIKYRLADKYFAHGNLITKNAFKTFSEKFLTQSYYFPDDGGYMTYEGEIEKHENADEFVVFTNEDVNRMYNLLCSVEKTPNSEDLNLIDIYLNEANIYFNSDNRTAAETAKAIQSRAAIYMSEKYE